MRKIFIETAAEAARLFRAELPKEQKEERVYVLPLDANGNALSKPILITVGYEEGTTGVDVRGILVEALKRDAQEIIVAHNHPSGDPTPSDADFKATVQLKLACRMAGLKFLDHIIIGAKDSADGLGFVSFKEMSLDD